MEREAWKGKHGKGRMEGRGMWERKREGWKRNVGKERGGKVGM